MDENSAREYLQNEAKQQNVCIHTYCIKTRIYNNFRAKQTIIPNL